MSRLGILCYFLCNNLERGRYGAMLPREMLPSTLPKMTRFHTNYKPQEQIRVKVKIREIYN